MRPFRIRTLFLPSGMDSLLPDGVEHQKLSSKRCGWISQSFGSTPHLCACLTSSHVRQRAGYGVLRWDRSLGELSPLHDVA